MDNDNQRAVPPSPPVAGCGCLRGRPPSFPLRRLAAFWAGVLALPPSLPSAFAAGLATGTSLLNLAGLCVRQRALRIAVIGDDVDALLVATASGSATARGVIADRCADGAVGAVNRAAGQLVLHVVAGVAHLRLLPALSYLDHHATDNNLSAQVVQQKSTNYFLTLSGSHNGGAETPAAEGGTA
jgi:hypothetical protein